MGRLEELSEKRRRSGLSEAEADELGRILAEREGRPYSNSSSGRAGAEEPEPRARGHSERFLSSSRPMHDPLLYPPSSGSVESELDAPADLGMSDAARRQQRRKRGPRRLTG